MDARCFHDRFCQKPRFWAKKKRSLLDSNHVLATTGKSCSNKKVAFSPKEISVSKEILGVFLGLLFEHKEFFGFSKYFQAICYTGTMLCHLIPGISEFFTRFPPSQPIANSIFDPILLVSFGIFFLIFLITVFLQLRHLKNNS